MAHKAENICYLALLEEVFWFRIWTLMPFSIYLYTRQVHRLYLILHIIETVL